MFPVVSHISYTSCVILSFRGDGQGQPSATIIGMALGLAVIAGLSMLGDYKEISFKQFVAEYLTSGKVGFVSAKF